MWKRCMPPRRRGRSFLRPVDIEGSGSVRHVASPLDDYVGRGRVRAGSGLSFWPRSLVRAYAPLVEKRSEAGAEGSTPVETVWGPSGRVWAARRNREYPVTASRVSLLRLTGGPIRHSERGK